MQRTIVILAAVGLLAWYMLRKKTGMATLTGATANVSTQQSSGGFLSDLAAFSDSADAALAASPDNLIDFYASQIRA